MSTAGILTTAPHECIRSALRKLNEPIHSLQDMEQNDEFAQKFNIRTASARAYVESIEELEVSVKAGHYTKRVALVWEMQRIAAMAEKLRTQREEREERTRELDDRHRKGLNALRQKIEAAEGRMQTVEADLIVCEAALAARAAAVAMAPGQGASCGGEVSAATACNAPMPVAVAQEAAPALQAGGGSGTQLAWLAGGGGGQQHEPLGGFAPESQMVQQQQLQQQEMQQQQQQLPPWAQTPCPQSGWAPAAARRPPPPPIPLAAMMGTAQAPEVPKGGEGSSIGSDDDENPWEQLINT